MKTYVSPDLAATLKIHADMQPARAPIVIPPSDRFASRRRAFSVSESLAHGLVNSLTASFTDASKKARQKVQPKVIQKRPAIYRDNCRVLRASVPDHMLVAEIRVGDQSGTDKNSTYTAIYWGAQDEDPTDSPLALILSAVSPRRSQIQNKLLLLVSRHAIMRLFFRLRTDTPAPVLAELNSSVQSLFHYGDVFDNMAPTAQILVPTHQGALVVVRDRDDPDYVAVKTWMSDARMVDNPRRQAAVRHARAEHGVVLNHLGAFPVISIQRLRAATLNDSPASGIDPEHLNRLCDMAYPSHSRLPSELRFSPHWGSTLTP